MSSTGWYALLLAAVAAERVAELVVSTRHVRVALGRGGVESGRGHYPLMVAVHTALLLGALLEVVLLDRPFLGWLGWPRARSVHCPLIGAALGQAANDSSLGGSPIRAAPPAATGTPRAPPRNGLARAASARPA